MASSPGGLPANPSLKRSRFARRLAQIRWPTPDQSGAWSGQVMTRNAISLSPALLLLIGFPIYESVQVLTERLLFQPYPRRAWGSWLIPAWAGAMVVTVIQFAVGTVAHYERLGASFLTFALPTILYALILAKLVRKLFPRPPDEVPASFLLDQFQSNSSYIYRSVIFLAAIPFLVFFESIASPPQIFRLVWVGLAVVGLSASSSRLWVHKALIVIGGPLTVALLVLYATWYGARE